MTPHNENPNHHHHGHTDETHYSVSDNSIPVNVEKAAALPLDPWEEYYKRMQHHHEDHGSHRTHEAPNDLHKPENPYQKAEQQLRHLVKSYKHSSDRNDRPRHVHRRSSNQRRGNDNHHHHHHHRDQKKSPNHNQEYPTYQSENHNQANQHFEHHHQNHQNIDHHEKIHQEHRHVHDNQNISKPQDHHHHPAHLSHLRQQPIIARPIGNVGDGSWTNPIPHHKPEPEHQKPSHFTQHHSEPQSHTSHYENPVQFTAQQLQSAHQVYLDLIRASPSPITTPRSRSITPPPPSRRLSHQHSAHPRPHPKRINPKLPSPFTSSSSTTSTPLLRNSKALHTSDSSDIDADEPHWNASAGQTATKPSAKGSLEVRIANFPDSLSILVSDACIHLSQSLAI